MSLATLSQKSVVVIISYSPTGLGHLRVSDSLYHGLPDSVTPILLGAADRTLSAFYRFVSIHPLTRKLLEFFQEGHAESFYTYWYRTFLRSHTQLLYQQLSTLLEERIDLPESVVLVATHYGLAHQFAAIKNRLQKEKKVRVVLVVQVTDDCPNAIWYIPNADTIFVPSEHTKQQLQEYGRKNNLPQTPFVVIPYPVSPQLKERLKPIHYVARVAQCQPDSSHVIHVVVPVSGAAVNTYFSEQLVNHLSSLSQRYFFHVISKNAPYTHPFLTKLLPMPSVRVNVSDHDRGVVNLYEEIFQQNVIGFEITKPSEQAFKALLRPTQRGGVILLFAQPVGKQEKDNLKFLRRHHLIPTKEEKEQLFRYSQKGKPINSAKTGEDLLKQATAWRGIELPENPISAAEFIHYCLKNNIFQHMLAYSGRQQYRDTDGNEVDDNGVDQFWKYTENLLIHLH
jgi:hypothetical protein